MRAQLRGTWVALAVALMALVYPACGDNPADPNEPDPNAPTPTTVVGSWVASSLTAPSQPGWGDAVTDDDLSVSISFTSNGNYTLSVSGDFPADPWICPGAASCSFTGTYTVSGNTMVFDPGTADETSATFAFGPGALTITYAANAMITDPYRIVLRPA